jgi:hypothetical protein
MRRPSPIRWVLAAALGAALAPVAVLAEGGPRAAPKRAEGTVSFVAAQSIYVSLGAEDGAEVGAELEVIRDGRHLGRLRIDAVSTRSAAAFAIEIAGEIRPGDTVVLTVTQRVAEKPQAAAAKAAPAAATASAAPLSSGESLEELWVKIEAAPPPKVPFRRGGAAAATPGTTRVGASPALLAPGTPPPPGGPPAGAGSNIAHGSLTAGYVGSFDRTKNSSDHTFHAPRASASITIERLFGEPITFRFRGDARAIIEDQDRLDRTGAKLRERIFFSEISLTYADPGTPIRISIGRIYASDAAQAGSLDGGRVGLAFGGFEFGGFGGLDAAPDFSDRGRLKYGAYASFRTPPAASIAYSGGLAFVRIHDGGDLDRQYAALDQRLLLGPYVTVFNLVEVDFTSGTPNSRERPNVDLTDVYAGVRVRPVRAFEVGLSYDRRRPFYGKRELDDLEPATLAAIDDHVWQTLRADARLWLPADFYVRGFGDKRLGAGDGLFFGGEVGCERIGGSDWRAAAGGSWSDTKYVRGTSYHGRAGAWITERLDVTLTYRVWFDDYDDGRKKVVRHAPGASIEWMATRALSFVADVEYAFGDEADRVLGSLSLTYRF